jgi:hypothetical protein
MATALGGGGEEIKEWHDWYALGRLIFLVHEFYPPSEGWWWWQLGFGGNKLGLKLLEWLRVKPDVTPQKIAELKDLLKKFAKKNWKVQPSDKFQKILEAFDTSGLMTHDQARRHRESSKVTIPMTQKKRIALPANYTEQSTPESHAAALLRYCDSMYRL